MEKICKTCGSTFIAISRFNFYCPDCTLKFKAANELDNFESMRKKFYKKDCIRTMPRKKK